MKIIQYPSKEKWDALCKRPYQDVSAVQQAVHNIFDSVKRNGDRALLDLTKKYDAPTLNYITASKKEIESAKNLITNSLKSAIKIAKENIEKYHTTQLIEEPKVETTAGVVCWRENRAIENIGLYIPGGTAPLFSTILMLGIPANIAGCKQICISTPPRQDGSIDPTILYTADLLGLNKIYKVGGAQAIAAMTIGTDTITKVDKIFGPGNQYVTEAKTQALTKGVAIDIPAGPSEVLIIGDQTSNPSFMAADLLAQAEHGPDSQVLLLSNELDIITKTIDSLNQQLGALPRKDVIKNVIKNSKAIILKTIDECIEFSNKYAPEHLIIASEHAEKYIFNIRNAGSVFIGNYSSESAGDYASGTNHTLPTNGYASSYSGVSIDSFLKKITFQKISKKGIQNLGPTIETMAQAEGLAAHKNAITIRLKSLANEQ